MNTPRSPKRLTHQPVAVGRLPVRWSHRVWLLALGCLLCAGGWTASHAAEASSHAESAKTPAKKPVASAPAEPATEAPQVDLGNDIKKALREKLIDRKKLTLVISDKPEAAPSTSKTAPATKSTPSASRAKPEETSAAPEPVAAPAAMPRAPAVAGRPAPAHNAAVVNPRASRDYIRAKAAAITGHESPAPTAASAAAPAHSDSAHGPAHWSYSGQTGPQAWSQLQPEFSTCALGKRQSPINIDDNYTLQGPAEPLQFNYKPSNGEVVNNGHTIQVNVQGGNTLTVRGTTYSLVQMHFHTPSEEQLNSRNFAMVAHLVHKSAEGQLAVVAVLLDPGVANPLIDKIWTYMPLDVNDTVRMPMGLFDLNELLPKDQRYYQFMGSLTTPPCTEGVLWMVLKQPAQISQAQLRLFQQLYPNNARPVQPLNGRPIRNAQ